MQTRIDDQAERVQTAVSEKEQSDGGADDIAFEQASRPAEEMRMLYMGFATGVTVGFIFLVYIILSAAHALP